MTKNDRFDVLPSPCFPRVAQAARGDARHALRPVSALLLDQTLGAPGASAMLANPSMLHSLNKNTPISTTSSSRCRR